MKILHIGGTGFLGSHIVKKLIERDHDLTIITRDPDREMPFDTTKVRFIKGDILQLDKLKISDRFDVMVYTAMVPFKPGRISNKKFKELEIITKQYFQNTIDLAFRLSCPLILTSGASFETKGSQVADETWPIARKGMAALGKCYDAMVSDIKNRNAIPLIEMLPAQIYGNGGMFDKMISMAKNGRIVILGRGNNCLPRIHVEDCADAYVLAIEKLPCGKKFILCDDENVSVRDFMLYLAQIFDVRKIVKIPNFILRLVTGKHVFPTLTMNTRVSNALIKKELGWKPKYPSYREGLRSLIE
ncbi:MAG: NAD(P)-dependent oxidoreductase [Bacteroidales bacterium]|uniref:NAD-dependent epimerase/dehydratase family protein n=1 Tax=Desulfobacter postgatei TaxID=2293 RepID=UPI0023F3B9C2|nr:NAD(P)-dependent oxidoreductase [Desulfobacter postgatei]MDD4275018.1 NAD(P)-dependent oxidoreductase [Desulfobacter postgatei]